jgi:hypothetical protein
MTGGAEHPHKDDLQDVFKKMAEILGPVHTRRRGLLQR